MAELRTLQSYLERLERKEDVKLIMPSRPVFVTKAKSMESGDSTRPLKPGESGQTIAFVAKPMYENPWDDVSVILADGPVRGSYLIGRSDHASFMIPNPTVSKEHAYLLGAEGRWSIRDNGSTNGTHLSVDATKYVKVLKHEACALRSQSWVRFGTVQTQFFEPRDFRDYLGFMASMYAQRKKN